jgi:hypothetical protein
MYLPLSVTCHYFQLLYLSVVICSCALGGSKLSTASEIPRNDLLVAPPPVPVRAHEGTRSVKKQAGIGANLMLNFLSTAS